MSKPDKPQEHPKPKRQAKRPQHKRAKIQYKFADGGTGYISLVAATEQLIRQYAWMASHEEPELRMIGRAKMREISEYCVAGQFFLGSQKDKAEEPRATIDTDDGGTSLADIARRLAPMRDELGDYLKPKDLRSLLWAELDMLGLNPKKEDKLGIDFDNGTIKWTVFNATINRERKKAK